MTERPVQLHRDVVQAQEVQPTVFEETTIIQMELERVKEPIQPTKGEQVTPTPDKGKSLAIEKKSASTRTVEEALERLGLRPSLRGDTSTMAQT